MRWAPQEEVLGHKAIGGFLTNSVWNSILESIAAGVPMICWPYFGDQQVITLQQSLISQIKVRKNINLLIKIIIYTIHSTK